MSTDFQYLFGPVPSRRLGRSLGIDLVPFKTCTQNCVFCQLGRTPEVIVERGNYVPMDRVLAELSAWTASGEQADAITLSGSGEPTLHLRFGDVLRYAKEHTSLTSVLLTNGSLLYQDAVCQDAVRADIVKVTLSAWDEMSYQAIHRPHPAARFADLLAGEQKVRKMCSGRFWVEVFLVEGLNTGEEQLQRLVQVVHTLEPDCIHINTAVRPAAERNVTAVDQSILQHAADLLGPRAEITAQVSPKGDAVLSKGRMLDLLKRHPCAAADLEHLFNATKSEVQACLDELEAIGVVVSNERAGGNRAYQVVE